MMSGQADLLEAERTPCTQRVGAFAELPALVRQLGGDPVALLQRAGLDADAFQWPEGRVSYRALCQFLTDAAASTRCPHLGLLAGRAWHLQNFGLVGEVMRHSATVRDALHALVVHQQLNSDASLAFMLEGDGIVDLGYAVFGPGMSRILQISDCAIAAAFNLVRELRPDWRPSQVLLAHSKPDNCRAYQTLFKIQPMFNAEVSALRFGAHWLDQRIDGADPVLRAAALSKIEARTDVSLVEQVFRALRVLLLHGLTSGDDVAGMLRMHRRTLGRRLQDQGVTFHQILDQVRLDVARQLLGESDVSLDDISAALGYAAPSSFVRTYRRWTGTTPARWRRDARSGRSAAAPRHREALAAAAAPPN